MASTNTTQQTTRCLRCGRALRSARSVANGYGPTCRAKVRQAARDAVVAQYKPTQVAKAQELIADGGIVAIRGRHVFQVAGSNGDLYKSHRAACTCPSGLRGRNTCYHRVAAHLLSLAA